MRKIIWAALLVIFIVPLISAEEKDISILVFGGANVLNKPDSLTEFRNTGLGFGIGVSFKGASGLEIIPRAAYRYFPLKETKYLETHDYPTDGSVEISGGNFRVWEIFCELKYGFWEITHKAPRIYATTGLGLAHTSYAAGKLRTGSDLGEINMGKDDIDIMMHIIGVGLEIPISKKHKIYAETGYMMIISEKENTYYIPFQAGLAIRME